MESYLEFLRSKIVLASETGFTLPPEEINPALKPHQRDAIMWALRGGRRALFESFGLGKTVQELEFCHQAVRHEGGKALIVLPLGVRQEFTRDAVELLHYAAPEYITTMAEADSAAGDILMTNYERVRDGDIDPTRFTAVALDEASVLRSFGSKTYQTFLPKFQGVKYKLVSTATPSPNRYKELIHYAGYLEIMDTGQALTRFFQRDSTKANNLTLYSHKEDEFWLWVSSWALFIGKPSDLGYDDTGYALPPLDVRTHIVRGRYGEDTDRNGQFKLMHDAAVSLAEASREKRESIDARVTVAKEIVDSDPEAHFLLWHDLEAERHAICKALPDTVDIYGSMDYAEREKRVIDFSEGRCRLFATKKSLSGSAQTERMARSIGVERVEVKGKNYTLVNNDCVEETARMAENSVDMILTSIPFSNHYEYTPSYNDFGHNEDTRRFFEQMDYLSPNLLRVLKPGRVFCCHVKDRVLFGNATGMGMPTMEPFHAMCIRHYMQHGFAYFGMITVVTDVVRENNQTYRLGWTEQCKDGSKMGVGCPEYILLFRKLPTDRSKAYADEPVHKTKEEYTRAQWQIDAHGYWRSSGDRLVTKEEIMSMDTGKIQAAYRKYSRGTVYDYAEHVRMAKELDENGKLPATFMVVAPGSWTDEVWDDINRMRTLNTTQSQRRQQLHVCPLQLDIVDRCINRYSNPGDLVYDPFGGIGTVPLEAVKAGRKGLACELNNGYFRDAVGYLQEFEREEMNLSLFDLMGEVSG